MTDILIVLLLAVTAGCQSWLFWQQYKTYRVEMRRLRQEVLDAEEEAERHRVWVQAVFREREEAQETI